MLLTEWTIDFSVLFRVFLSLFLGGLIGLEREWHGRPAGLRTHVMVCLGATSLMLASEYTQTTLEAGTGIFNPDRIAAGIITGIGFLGAGAIMREENLMRGLTTAGCIWFVAGLGIVIGKAYYSLSIIITLAALVVLILFRFAQQWFPTLYFPELTILVAAKSFESVTDQCAEIFREEGLGIEEKKLTIDHAVNEVEIKYTLRMMREKNKEEFILKISRIPGVRKVIG